MDAPSDRRWDRLCDAVPLAGAVLLVWPVVVAWWSRVGHPYDLEWMEGGMLAHAWRLQRGLQLYGPVSPDWVPYIYPPGYSAVLATSADALSYGVGRGVSIGSTLLAALALAVVGRRHGGSWTAGLCAAAAFVGCYRASGAFYDLVRPDALALALGAWCLVLAADGRRGTHVASGLLLAAAFTVKHNLAALGFPIALALWARSGWRTGLGFGLASAVPAGLFTLWMQWRSGGWFLVYLIDVPSSHPVVGARFWHTGSELGKWLLPALLTAAILVLLRVTARYRRVPTAAWLGVVPLAGLAAYGVMQVPAPRGVVIPEPWMVGLIGLALGTAAAAALIGLGAAAFTRHAPWRLWLGVGCGAVLLTIAALMRAHHGGFLNVLMPAHWAILAGFAIAVGRLGRWRPGWLTSLAGAALLSTQLWWTGSQLDVEGIVPNEQDLEAGAEVVAVLRERCDGPIFAPYAAWLPVYAGQPPSPHLIALWDLDHDGGPLHAQLPRFKEAAREHHWACVLTGGTKPIGFGTIDNYTADHRFELSNRALVPKTGWRVRPRELLVPRVE